MKIWCILIFSFISANINGEELTIFKGNYLSLGLLTGKQNYTLTIEGGEISNNKAEYGAGVYVERGALNHKGGTISGNNAELVGGGVYVKRGATYTAGDGTISGNNAGDGGEDLFKQ